MPMQLTEGTLPLSRIQPLPSWETGFWLGVKARRDFLCYTMG